MKPVPQTKLHNPPEQNGNCLAAALASLLELDISEVPEFEDMEGDSWWFKLIDWLHSIGFHLVVWDQEIHYPGFYIVGGTSPRGDFLHSVIYENGKLVHDPHPSGDGLVKIKDTWALLPFNPVQF